MANPLQYSCPENPTDRRAWQATDHVVTESDMTERLHFDYTEPAKVRQGRFRVMRTNPSGPLPACQNQQKGGCVLHNSHSV